MHLDELESWGLQFGKLQKLTYHWSAPPTAEKMHIPYAAPKKQASRKTKAVTSVSREAAAATWASAPPPPQPHQQQQRLQQQSPPPQQPAANASRKSWNRGGRGKGKSESAKRTKPSPGDRHHQADRSSRGASTLYPGVRRDTRRDTRPWQDIPRYRHSRNSTRECNNCRHHHDPRHRNRERNQRQRKSATQAF